MSGINLRPVPITTERFAPYGDVIHAAPAAVQAMNDARFERFDDDMVERHPLGSQAFIPLAPFSFVVVVAPAGESVDIADLRAFVTNGSQGINYHKGVWHMPLIATEGGQAFLVIDRVPGENNCEQVVLGESIVLEVP